MSSEPRAVIGLTELPADLPNGSIVARKDCGCYLIFYPGDPGISEFTCEYGYFVVAQRKPPPADGTVAVG